ncbi:MULTISPECIES: HAD family hydrolase [unclassified Paenibacillus]|uniref:HAD family hydrolase n=1 Tax=unclassified Paenibacillus TaxID=185978 RepID=UPI0036308014
MDWLGQIEVVLFDLDGTLYRDDMFYKRYLEILLMETEHEATLQDVTEELTRMLEGQNLCRIGDWYHPGRDIWMRLFNDRVMAFDWKGEPVESDDDALEGSRSGLIYAGDAWSLVSVTAHRYGISEEKRRAAFFQVRKEMLAGASGFTKHNELFETIDSLTGVQAKILLTNSPSETAQEFIHALGCINSFDEIHYSTGKPAGLESFSRELMQKMNVQPHQLLSIGDHAWNDLYPIRSLGGRTVWISPVASSETEKWDVNLPGLDELTEFLKQLQQAKAVAAS